MKIIVNGQVHEVKSHPDTPLLWVLRDELGLVGTKYGCGQSLCGACTVIIDGEATRSCSVAIGDIEDEVRTIEGIGSPDKLHIIQQAWIHQQVAQCGYCQSGQIMNALALLEENKNPSDENINTAMSGNLCRCGTYPRIRAAIKEAANKLNGS